MPWTPAIACFGWLLDDGGVSTYMLKDLFAFMPLLEREGLLNRWRDTETMPSVVDTKPPRDAD